MYRRNWSLNVYRSTTGTDLSHSQVHEHSPYNKKGGFIRHVFVTIVRETTIIVDLGDDIDWFHPCIFAIILHFYLRLQ